MPAISRPYAVSSVSGDEPETSEGETPVRIDAPVAPRVIGPRRSPFALLWREAARTLLARAKRPLIDMLRGGWLYRKSLRGPVPDRVLFHPSDPAPKRLDEADAYFRGRFRFDGQQVEIKHGSVFDAALPSPGFAAALHGFDWLIHLEAAGGGPARDLARALVSQWLKRNARYRRPAWQPEVIARRLTHIFAHGKFFLQNSDLMWRSRLFVSLRNQTRVLARSLLESPEGLPRLETSAGLALAGVCLGDAKNVAKGLEVLSVEIGKQILADGGHVSRSPAALASAFRVLSMVQQALDAANYETCAALRSALDRMAPMLRFFRMGDGALASFNGAGEGDAKMVTGLLAFDETQGRPYGHAPHSGFQRLSAGRTVVVLDSGAPPPPEFSGNAHAGCLSFEMSSGAHRIVVNCGPGHGSSWDTALRATAAHSTLGLGDTSSAYLLPKGILRDLLGVRLLAGPTHVETRRFETDQGIFTDDAHDGYAVGFGVEHQRRLMLAPKGVSLTGMDRLIPISRSKTKTPSPFTIRFHIHPDVRLSLAQSGSVLLKLPNGEGWRFRCGGAELKIEDSIYLGGGTIRRAEQLVLAGEVSDKAVECAWIFEHVGVTS